jgi:hypothetical protein
LLPSLRPDLVQRLPEPQTTVAGGELGIHLQAVLVAQPQEELAAAGASLSTAANTPIGTNSQAVTGKPARSPAASSRRHLNTWLAFTSCRRATTDTEATGTSVSATIRRFSATGHDRRRFRRSPTTRLYDGVHLALVDTIDPHQSPHLSRLQQPAGGRGSPDGYEAFKARMRDELFNETLFFSLGQAREALARWIADDNHCRPHSAIGYQTPAAYAARLTATDDRLRVVDALRQPTVAPSARERQSEAPAPVSVG